MRRCKHCGGVDLGVVVKVITETPYRIVGDGEPVKMAEPNRTKEFSYQHCFSCNTPITNEDVIEYEVCEVCGKTVDSLEDGCCKECNEEKKKLLSMDQNELIKLLLKSKVNNTKDEEKNPVTKQEETKVETETKVNVETKEVQPKQDVKEVDKISIDDINNDESIDTDISNLSEIDDDAMVSIDNIDLGSLNLEEDLDDDILI